MFILASFIPTWYNSQSILNYLGTVETFNFLMLLILIKYKLNIFFIIILDNEMQARRVAKAWSGNEDSEIETFDSNTRKRISTIVFTQEVQQKKIKNTKITSSTSSNLPNSFDLTSFPTPPASITSASQATSSKQPNTSNASQICTTTIRPNTMAITNHTLPPMMGSPQHDVPTDQSILNVASPKSLPDILLSPQLSPNMPSSPQLFPDVSPRQSLTDIEYTQSSQEVVTSNFQYTKPIDSRISQGDPTGNIL